MIFYKNSSGTIHLNNFNNKNSLNEIQTWDPAHANKTKLNEDVKLNELNKDIKLNKLNEDVKLNKLNEDVKLNELNEEVKTNLREDIIINNGFILEHYLKLKDIEKEINEQLEYYKDKEEKDKDNNYIKLLEEMKININNNIEYYENIVNKYNITSKRKHKHINKTKSYYKKVSEEERQRRNNKAKERYHKKKQSQIK